MKILGIDIDWMEKYGNPPEIIVQVDKVPFYKDLRYTRYECHRGTLYVAEHTSGYVNFMYENDQNHLGSAGRKVTIDTDEGEVTIDGPWSSRASIVNEERPERPCVTVAFKEPSGSRIGGGALLLPVLLEALKKYHPGLRLNRVHEGRSNRFDFYLDKAQMPERV